VFRSSDIWRGYGNTIFYTVFGTLINVVLTIMIAYPLARRDFYGRNLIMFLVTFTMMFSGGIIPTFLLVRALGIEAAIPGELLEASQLDGCSNTRFILSVVLPLSGPIVAVITLFYAVMHWNAFFSALIYLRNSKLFPLQIILRAILLENQIDYQIATNLEQEESRQMIAQLLKFALIVVASMPMMLIYPFVQKYFVRGVLIGALKG
jgi:putative aldouronate transport system permease protein